MDELSQLVIWKIVLFCNFHLLRASYLIFVHFLGFKILFRRLILLLTKKYYFADKRVVSSSYIILCSVRALARLLKWLMGIVQ